MMSNTIHALVKSYEGKRYLWLYKYGCLVDHLYIDPCYDAIAWNSRHGMRKADTVTADNGEMYDIWKGNGYANAIPCA